MPRTRLHFMQLCAITDRKRATQPLLSLVEGWSTGGVDFIQLREKDLSAAALQSLAREVIGEDRSPPVQTAGECLHARVGRLGTWRPARTEFILPAASARVRPARCGKLFALAARSSACPATAWRISMWPVEERVDLMLFSPVFEKLSSRDFRSQPRVSRASASLARRREASRCWLWAA